MGRPRKNPIVTDSSTTETIVNNVEVVRDNSNNGYVPGIRGKRDRYAAGEKKAANLTSGDKVYWAIAKDGDVNQSASVAKDMYGAYTLKDSQGNEIKNNELIAMGVPKAEYDAKISEEKYKTSMLLRANIEKAKREGLRELNPTSKKYFNMGG